MICFISFMLLLGTVGSIEVGTIGLAEGTIKSIIFLIIFGISSIRYWNIEDKRALRKKIEKFFLK